MRNVLFSLVFTGLLISCGALPKEESEDSSEPTTVERLSDEARKELVESLDEQIESLEERLQELENQKGEAGELLQKELQRAVDSTVLAIQRIREQRRKVIEEAMPDMDEVSKEVDKVINETTKSIEDAFRRWRDNREEDTPVPAQ